MRAPRAWHAAAEALLLPLLALTAALLLFGVFVAIGGRSPVQAWELLFRGAFGDAFSWQNTLQRAAPLMLTALCVALPARAGLTVIEINVGAEFHGLMETTEISIADEIVDYVVKRAAGVGAVAG